MEFDWQQSKRELAAAVDAVMDARYSVKRLWLNRPSASYARKWIIHSGVRLAFALAFAISFAWILLSLFVRKY